MVNRRGTNVGFEDRNPRGLLAEGLPEIRRSQGEDAAAAAASFARISDALGGIADRQAQAEGAREGAIAGASPDYKPTDSSTIRGQASDRAGTATFLANLNAGFSSDAVDLYEKHKADPAGFKTAFEGATASYAQQVPPEMRGEFQARATQLGTQLRVKVASGFETKQRENAVAGLYRSQEAQRSATQKLAITDPDGEGTLAQAKASLVSLEAQIDGMVGDEQLTPLEGEKQKKIARATTLLTIYGERAERMTDPGAIDTLRKQVRADFTAGKMPLLDAEAFEKLDTGLDQLSRKRRVEIDQTSAAFGKKLDDWVERSAKSLTPAPAETEALAGEAKGLGARGEALFARAQAKARVARLIDVSSPAEADAYVRRLEQEAKGGGSVAERIIGVESGGRADARNPRSSAAGAGQFIDSTWLDVIGRNEPQLVAGKSRAEILALRDDAAIARRMTVAYEAENRQALQNAGRAGTDGELYLAHFAGPAGAKAVLADPGASVTATLGADVVAANPFLARMTNADLARWADRKMQGGVSSVEGEVITFARARLEARRKLEATDPLLAAERAGIVPGGVIAPLDWNGPALADQVSARANQAEAVARLDNKPATYLRPDEKQALSELMKAGGQKALDVLDGLVAGAGMRAPQVLAEIGDGAPELAHATMVGLQTGDRSLQRSVAAALEARQVKGGSLPRPSDEQVETAMRETAGIALRGLDLGQRARVKATAALLVEREAAARGADFKNGDTTGLIGEALQRASGRTKRDGKDWGGFAEHRAGGWFGARYTVQVPPDMRADKFSDALRALTDADLAGLADPPVDAKGKPMSAADLMRFAPHAGHDTYRFGNPDPTTGELVPVRAKSGRPFALPWAIVAPALRSRVPDAFAS